MGKKQGKKQKKRKGAPPKQGRNASANASTPVDADAAERALAATCIAVSNLIAENKTKSAVDLAKQMHKALDLEASEALLAEAYAARIRGMIAKGMGGEARALLDLLRSRHPAVTDVLGGLALDLAAQTGSFDELLRPLANPDLTAAVRREIEDTVRCRATDLQALAECGVLPPEHALRQAAQAAWTAFQAVTSGPAEDEVFALPEISRRSPLAPWKTLIHAIACFYRREDEKCRRYLRAIDPDTPPGRILPVLEAMMDKNPPPADSPPAKSLMDGVGGDLNRLRGKLKQVDHVIGKAHYYDNNSKVMQAVRSCANGCANLDAPTAKRIQLHLWIRVHSEGFNARHLDRAFPSPVLRDSSFWSLLAQFHMMDAEERESAPLIACAAWEEFRSQAVHEGLFPDESPESAAVYRLMRKLVKDIPEDEMQYERDHFFGEYPQLKKLYQEQPSHIRKASAAHADQPSTAYFLDPEKIHARIATADPSPKSYCEWFEWNKKPKQADQIANRWAKAFPQDAEPLLLLMEAAEKRNAYKKALGYLTQAEALDALDPKVRRAHFRLHLGVFERHLKQNKPRLAAKDLDAIEALPPLDGQDRQAVLAALRSVLSILTGDSEESGRFQKTAAAVLEDALAAEILCWGVAANLGVPDKQLPQLTGPSARLKKGVRAAAVARANALARDAGLALPTPHGWNTKLRLDLRDHAGDVDIAHLQAYAEVLIETEEHEMAYYATRAGLLQGEAHPARFMLLRAKTLPRDCPWRRLQCISAAVELARSQRDFDVLDEAVDTLNADSELKWVPQPNLKLTMAAQHLQQVIAFERRQKKAPGYGGYTRAREKHYYTRCKCNACHEGRRYRPTQWSGPFGFNPFAWEDEEEDSAGPPDIGGPIGDWDPFGGDIPEALESEVCAIIERLVGKGCPFTEIEFAVNKRILEFLQEQTAQQLPEPDAEPEPGKQGDLLDDIKF